MSEIETIPLGCYQQYSESEMLSRANEFYELVRRRRTVREFSNSPVPIEVVQRCILAAGTAPNGANLQPWHFAIVADAGLKRQIRAAAEAEEREFYHHKAPPEWLEVLRPLGTDEHKPFLEVAPYLVVVFSKPYEELPDGRIRKHYYVNESVGIATGILITALHHCGLATLTHTPSPMGFLNQILNRPKYERPTLILVVGYPAPDARVPKITKKRLEEIASMH